MKFNILIAEDEQEIRDILISLVKTTFKKDYPFLELNISAVENGSLALDIARTEHQDIILTDIVMPVMDGFEFIQNVRLFDKNVPILVLSSLDSDEDINKIIRSGANNYTKKPLIPKLFKAQIKVFIDFYLRRQNKYNHSAINLFSKKIYKRKTEFLIEKEDDIIEFWEFLVEGIFDKYKLEAVLKFIYDLELFMIKKSLSNTIILEESDEKFYLTLSEIDKVDTATITLFKESYQIKDIHYKDDGFFISLIINKQENDIKEKIPQSSNDNNRIERKDIPLSDIRYSVREKVSPDEFLAELDSTVEDKVESFLNELSVMFINIYNLQEEDASKARTNINSIVEYFDHFNEIIETLALFSVINRSFNKLNNFLTTIEDNILQDTEKRFLLSKMLQGLADDLENWIRTLFIDRNATDIHYLDASFADNCYAIENTFITQSGQDTQTSDEEDLEFF